MLSFNSFFVVLLIVTLSITEGRPTVEDDEIEMVNATMEMDIEENGTYSEYVHGYTPPPYQCNNSLASFETFHICDQRNMKGMTSVHSSLTTEQIMNNLNDFCKMKPAILNCTLERAINCPAEVQQGLIQGVQAGLVCEAGGGGNVHPNVQYIFERLGEEGITEFPFQYNCRVNDMKVFEECSRQAFSTADIDPHSDEEKRALQQMALPDLFVKAGMYLKAMTECLLRSMANELNHQTSCNWKVYAIRYLQHMYFPPMLGVNFPFTQSELDELFQFGNGNNV